MTSYHFGSSSLGDQRSLFYGSNSLTQSATNVFGKALASVGVINDMSYLSNDSETLCTICLEGMDEEEGNLFTVSPCSHTYHKKCIAEWKKGSKKCPCCRGPLPDELGQTIPNFQNLPPEEVLPNSISENAVFNNVIFCALGIAYPLFLLVVFIAFEAFLLAIVFVALYACTFYAICCEKEDDDCTDIEKIFYFLCIHIMFPLLVCFLVLGFVLQICYVSIRALRFYTKVLMCKIGWRGAYSFIILRTLTLTEHVYDYYDNILTD